MTGKARYTMDVDAAKEFPGLLHLKVVRSPHAHARLRSIDRSKALAHPGVVAIFTVPMIVCGTSGITRTSRSGIPTRSPRWSGSWRS